MTRSISSGYTLFPPVIIILFFRPITVRAPYSSKNPISPMHAPCFVTSHLFQLDCSSIERIKNHFEHKYHQFDLLKAYSLIDFEWLFEQKEKELQHFQDNHN